MISRGDEQRPVQADFRQGGRNTCSGAGRGSDHRQPTALTGQCQFRDGLKLVGTIDADIDAIYLRTGGETAPESLQHRDAVDRRHRLMADASQAGDGVAATATASQNERVDGRRRYRR